MIIMCLLQLANAERRLAKRHVGGRFAMARAFYAAAAHALEGEAAFGALQQATTAMEGSSIRRVDGPAAAAAQLQPGLLGGAEDVLAMPATPEAAAMRRRRAGDVAPAKRHVRVDGAEDCDGDPAREPGARAAQLGADGGLARVGAAACPLTAHLCVLCPKGMTAPASRTRYRQACRVIWELRGGVLRAGMRPAAGACSGWRLPQRPRTRTAWRRLGA